MAVHIVAPAADLASVVRVFVHAQIRNAHTQLLLPETGIVIAIRFGGAAEFVDGSQPRRVPLAAVSGLTSVARRLQVTGSGGVVLVLFRELGAARVFASPLHEVHGATLALADLAPPRAVERLEDRFHAADDVGDRIAIVECFLRARLDPQWSDPLVGAAVRAIRDQPGAVRIASLARAMGISQDRFEKRFRRMVGASPKQFASILRFRRVLVGHQTGMRLAQLAHDLGYCDQSHLTRDFRAVTGVSPGEFLRTAEYGYSPSRSARLAHSPRTVDRIAHQRVKAISLADWSCVCVREDAAMNASGASARTESTSNTCANIRGSEAL